MQSPEQKPTNFSDEDYTPDESDEVFKRAAELQSRDTLSDASDNLDRATLEKSAGRAGIDEKYVKQAVEQLRVEEKAAREKQAQLEAQRAARRQQLRKLAVPAAVIFGLYLAIAYSLLNNKYTAVEEKQAQLETVLQRRHNLIPNLIAASKAATAHEKDVFDSLAQLEKQASATQDFAQHVQLETQLSAATRQALNELRDDPGGTRIFVRLSDEMAGAENRISTEQMRYNQAVAEYNRTARAFPIFLVRPLLGFPAQKPRFQAESAAHEAPRF